ncbi:MAG: ABC transporter ATP-binding protein [Proteobacteria bacterium]|nr:ABC transporter ATP-binding protein [Pseudomonadota bacterium]
MSATALLCARGLEKRFGTVAALRGVDLEITEGRSLAILGANGAGKSTLLRILAGLARATRGELRIAGGSGTRAALRAQVGFVGHATGLYGDLTARENLIFAARLQDVPRPGEVADRLLDEEGLAALAERRAGTFSRGMAQRLALARARVHQPPLLLLDEPYTGLDHRAAERLTGRLQALRDEGRTLVFVTHDPARAEPLADAAVLLVQGRLSHRAAGADELAAGALERALAEAAAS